MRLYLASQSPRRRELLLQLGLDHELVAPAVDESLLPGESAAAYVERLARRKALAGKAALPPATPAVVIGADTCVVVDGEILGKPDDATAAAAMLRRLAGRTHQVLTGVAVAQGETLLARVSVTDVMMIALSEADIAAYCATGEPLDKAGAYGIQGRAAAFISRIEGSYSGVVGLPLCETAELLKLAGYGAGRGRGA
ncbi:MAG: Maf family protein [Spongiibacteraceae bacterium]|jgi:septum formation protein|nr:Maf family protein [Spongiibacteraceae bacterium]